MKSAVIESGATPLVGECTQPRRRSYEEHTRSGSAGWRALYAVLLASVGLCVGGNHVVAAVGHAALIQCGVAIVILGLLAAWVRRSRPALFPATPGAQPPSQQPFSVIHVAFSPGSVGSSQHTPLPGPAHRDAADLPPAPTPLW